MSNWRSCQNEQMSIKMAMAKDIWDSWNNWEGVNERSNRDRTVFKPYKLRLIQNNLTIK